MRYIIKLFYIIIALLVTLSGIVAQPSLAAPSDISAASRSVVRVGLINVKDGKNEIIGHGSGVAIAPDKILTNAHVVNELRYDPNLRIAVIPSEGSTNFAATIIALSPKNDLALLQIIGGGRITSGNVFIGPINDGSDVFAIGYPGNVDVAQGLSLADMIRPQAPVKTKGSTSAGRSVKDFETLLHTAPIGGGNSGGPLVDNCGRIVGINSFGSLSNGNDAEFFFAIAASEIMKFLRKANVSTLTSNTPCRSVAELTRAENERAESANRQIEAEKRAEEKAAETKIEELRRNAQYEVLSQRDSKMAFAFLFIIIALVMGAGSFLLFERNKRTSAKLMVGTSVLAIVFASISYSSRPNFGDIEDIVAEEAKKDKPGKSINDLSRAGKKTCIINTERSRITVSDTTDIHFNWSDSGCINNRTQYGPADPKWTRTFVPNVDSQISVVSYDPRNNIYQIERYLPGLSAMNNARKARNQFQVRGCTTDTAALEKIDNMNKAVGTVLPKQPNEMLIYECRDIK